MKSLMLSAIALSLSLAAGASFAADSAASSAVMTAKACHKEAAAKKLHGTERTKFMKDCKAGKAHS